MLRAWWLAPILLFAVKTEKPKPAPPPNVELTVQATPGSTRWKVRIENKDAVPLRLVADARLVSFEIEPPAEAAPANPRAAKPKPVKCTLPADMRPQSDDERLLVLPPGRAYAETIDPRLYCFGAKESAALAAGGKVTALMGWTGALTRPFVISPFEGVEPRVAAAKSIASAPFTLPASSSPIPPPPPAPTASATLTPKLSVSIPQFIDAATGNELAVTVSVANASDRAVVLRLRADTVTFDVTAPNGTTTRCSRPQLLGTPMRELFDTVPAHGSANLAVLLSAVCPAGTFDQVGLYQIVPGIDTRRASGEKIGLATFEGEVAGTQPSLLRVRTARNPPPKPRPVLE